MLRTVSAPSPRTSSKVKPLTVACVATGMNMGVCAVPWGVVICPRRAAPSVANSLKLMGDAVILSKCTRAAPPKQRRFSSPALLPYTVCEMEER